MSVDVHDDDYYHPYHDIKDAADGITECMTDLAHWLYKSLEREYEYLQSEENFLESYQDVDYLYTEDGELVY